MTNSEVAIIVGMIVFGTIALAVAAFVVGMSMRSPLPARTRIATICIIIGAAIMSIKLGIDIYQGDSWIKSAILVGAAVASAFLVWFTGNKKIEQRPNNEH